MQINNKFEFRKVQDMLLVNKLNQKLAGSPYHSTHQQINENHKIVAYTGVSFGNFLNGEHQAAFFICEVGDTDKWA